MTELGFLFGNGIELVVCKDSMISYPLHNHVSVFIIGFVLDGAVELVTDKGIRLYQKKSSFVILPYTPHCLNAKSRYALLSLCIKKDLVPETDIELLQPAISEVLHKVIKESNTERWILQTVQGLFLFFQMMPMRRETVLANLRERLETHPEEQYRLEDMAKLTFTSKYSLIRSFKQEIGLTPHQFLIQNRVRKAQALLKESGTIAEVALATGFCDQSHFVRCFEKIVGVSPTDYKRSVGALSPCFPIKQALE